MVIKKIKARTKEEKDTIESLKRDNRIRVLLNSHFEEKSLDLKDKENILDWACSGVAKSDLVYLLEKKKMEILK